MKLKPAGDGSPIYNITDPGSPISQTLPRSVERGSLLDAVDGRARQLANVHAGEMHEVAAIELMVATVRRAMLFMDEEEIRTALREIGDAVMKPWTLVDLYIRFSNALRQIPEE